MARKNGSKRLNAKQDIANKAGMIMAITLVVWVLFLLDTIFVTHVNIAIVLMLTMGIWGVGLIIAKPGEFAKKVHQDGFWRALFGNGSNQSRRQRRR